MNKEQRKQETERIKAVLHVEDPIDLFETKSIKVGARIGIAPKVVRESIVTLKDTFGEEWLRQQATTFHKEDAAEVCDHPLGDIFSIVGESSVTEACELALYLSTLASVPRLDKVIKNLKAVGQYETSLLQLAFAYRFHAIGAECLELEPPTSPRPGSTAPRAADIAFDLWGHSYLVECYIPTSHPLLPEDSGELKVLASELLNGVLRGKQGHHVVMLRPKRRVTIKERNWLLPLIEREVQEMGESSLVEIEKEAVSIQVRRVDADELHTFQPRSERDFYGGAHCCMMSSEIPIDQLRVWRTDGIPPKNKTNKDIVLAWSPPRTEPIVTLDEWIDDLRKQIDEKIAQARRNDNARRVVLVSIPQAKEKTEEMAGVIATLGGRLQGNHNNYAGVYLLARVRWETKHHGYVGYALAGKKEHALPREAVQKINYIDAAQNILRPRRTQSLLPISATSLATRRRDALT